MSLNPRFTLGALDLTDWPFAVEFGSSFGNPQNVAEVVDSLLQDGEIIASTRTSNRELKIPLLIEESDMLALAGAESALLLEADKQRNTLTVDPGDGYGVPTVFDTFRAQVEFVRNDDEEIAGCRRYLLTLPALPFGHSETAITVTSTASTAPTRTVLLDGSTTAGWTPSAATATAATVGSRACVKFTNTGGTSFNGSYYSSTASATVTVGAASSFVSVDFWSAGPGAASLTLVIGGSSVPVAKTVTQSDGFVRYFWDTSSLGSFTGEFIVQHTSGSPFPSAATWYLDELATQTALGTSLPKQAVFSLDVKGSARSPGSLHVTHASGLGQAIVFTSRDLGTGFAPNLRAWRSSGASETTDATMMSGKFESLGIDSSSSFTATVPNRMCPPGTYMIVARLNVLSAGTITAKVLDGSTVVQSCSTKAEATSGYAIVPIGLLRLPAKLPAPGAAGTFGIRVETNTGASVLIDEAWAFPVENSALSICSSANKHLWLESPSSAQPFGAAWTGGLADKSDAFSANGLMLSRQHHTLYPGQTLVFVATSAPSTPPTVDATYFAHFHSHATQVA